MNKGLRRLRGSYKYIPVSFLWENSDLMNKGLRRVKYTTGSSHARAGENSDLMNKGLRRANVPRPGTSRHPGENSDLMNKGLRRKCAPIGNYSPPRIERILTWWIKDCDTIKCFNVNRYFGERILTWWIKDCDEPDTDVGIDPYVSRENSDLMNKGLRPHDGSASPTDRSWREFWLDE